MGLAPPGATSKIQPLDVAFNAEFKKSVDRLTIRNTIILFANPELFMSEGYWRVLFTKWVGTTWQETSRWLKDTVIRSFVKCDIAMPISGSRDSEINIDGLPDYRINESADVEEIKFFSDSEGGKLNSVLLVHDTPMRFILQYIEFSILILRNVPVVNTKLYQFSFHTTPSVN